MVRSSEQLFRLIGATWVIIGGLVAAVTGPLDLEHGSWTAAFSVLVAGVAQYTIGMHPGRIDAGTPAGGVALAGLDKLDQRKQARPV